MKNLSLIIVCLFLASCAVIPKQDEAVAVKYKYIVNTIPDEMLKLPDPMYKIDVTKATDKDAAKWILDSEQRSLEIEQKIRAINNFQKEKLENLKVPKEDLIKN